jgi:hypothetical protein
MALVYLVNKPQVSRIVARWLLLFLGYDSIVVYKLSRIHVVANVLSRLPNTTKPIRMLNQTPNVNIFYTEPKWLDDVIFF